MISFQLLTELRIWLFDSLMNYFIEIKSAHIHFVHGCEFSPPRANRPKQIVRKCKFVHGILKLTTGHLTNNVNVLAICLETFYSPLSTKRHRTPRRICKI